MKRALLCALLISMIGVTAWTQDLPAQLPEMGKRILSARVGPAIANATGVNAKTRRVRR